MRSALFAGIFLAYCCSQAAAAVGPFGNASAPTAANQSELQIRGQVASNVAALFGDRNFAGLNRLAFQYGKGERTPSGIWKLNIFYRFGLGFAPSADAQGKAAWKAIFAITQEWITKAPSPAAYIALADFQMAYGAQLSAASGNGKADEYAWTRMAQKLLNDHKKEASIDPHWYVAMEQVADVMQWPEADIMAVYREGVKAHPYYYDIYYGAVDAMTNHWIDATRGLMIFSGEAAKNTSDQEGMAVFARIMLHASLEGVISSEMVMQWSMMKPGIRDVLARYPDQWNINNFAHIACASLDMDLAKSLTDRITSVDELAWDKHVPFELCRKWSHGQASGPLVFDR